MSTLEHAFEQFKNVLEPVEGPVESILDRQRVREVLRGSWQVTRDAVVGSYKRNTHLRPAKDLDVWFLFGSKHQPYVQADPEKLLKDLAVSLDLRLPAAHKTVRTHSLGLRFADFTVHLIPAFERHGGGSFMPDTGLHRWIPTDPDAHARAMADASKRGGPRAVSVIRMLKLWRRAKAPALRGFHLEQMVARALTAPPDGLVAGCLTGLDAIAAGVKGPCPAPSAIGDDVASYLALEPETRAKIARAATDAASALRSALERAEAGATTESMAMARGVFGPPFPPGA